MFNQSKMYKPSEVTRKLSKEYGHELSVGVIRKWDYQLLSDLLPKRAFGARRNYSEEEVFYFHFVAVLRSLWYTLPEIKLMLGNLIRNNMVNVDSIEIKARVARQIDGFNKILKHIS